MSRLIDADLLGLTDMEIIMCDGDYKEALKMLIDKIEHAPTIEPEQRWIPCSERLPNTNGIYIVTRRISDGFECRNITDACYFDGSNTWHDDTRVNHKRKYLADVLAWMPLPEPYREDKKNE